MALRATVYASLPATLLGASMAPGFGCEVSRCCKVFNSSQSLANVFDDSLPSYASTGYTVTRDRQGYSPACSFLNLVPGIFDKDGMCSNLTDDMQNTTVRLAIAASEEASDRVRAGRSILSVFVEPGTCAKQQNGACWESGKGVATYQWDSFGMGNWDSGCTGQVPVMTPALSWSMTCPREGGLTIQAKWVDGNATDESPHDGSACSRDYAGGLQTTIRADGWVAGSDGSPRWRCFDVPRGDMGLRDYRILAYSIGDLPCVATTTTATTTHIASSGSSSPSLTAFVHAVAAAVAMDIIL